MNFNKDNLCGFVLDIDYKEAKIITEDNYIREVNGLEQGAFLIAKIDDDKHVLLRVLEPEGLMNEQNKSRAKNDIYSNELVINDSDYDIELSGADDVDPYTKSELQKQAYKCKVVGVFYEKEGELVFGGDLPVIYSGNKYEVYKPSNKTLDKIINYNFENEPITVGKLNYSETIFEEDNNYNIDSSIDINDFIGTKTAFFGMTRTGKSNSIKVLSSALHEKQLYDTEEENFGQLIIDVSGEYANPNKQDKSITLAQLPNTVVYTQKNVWKKSDYFKPILDNLYYKENREQLIELIKMELISDIDKDYIDDFISSLDSINIEEENLTGKEYVTNPRKLSILYSILNDRNLEMGTIEFDYNELTTSIPKPNFSDNCDSETYFFNTDEVQNDINKEINEEINSHWNQRLTKRNGKTYIQFEDLDDMSNFWTDVSKYLNSEDITEAKNCPFDNNTFAMLNFLESKHSGTRKISNIQHYHNKNSDNSLVEDLYDELEEGNLVILDMSVGREDIVAKRAESAVKQIYKESNDRFRDNENVPHIKIYLEEAHRHFDSESIEDNNIYVRMAKEGAKLNIGLAYATQEVSSIDDRVLSNTANWFVTHLNNDFEIKNLIEYYDFKDFKNSIKKVDAKGYTKLRTDSHRYTIPIRMYEFTEDTVKNIGFKDSDITSKSKLIGGDS